MSSIKQVRDNNESSTGQMHRLVRANRWGQSSLAKRLSEGTISSLRKEANVVYSQPTLVSLASSW